MNSFNNQALGMYKSAGKGAEALKAVGEGIKDIGMALRHPVDTVKKISTGFGWFSPREVRQMPLTPEDIKAGVSESYHVFPAKTNYGRMGRDAAFVAATGAAGAGAGYAGSRATVNENDAAGNHGSEKSKEYYDYLREKRDAKKPKDTEKKDEDSKDKESTGYAPYIGAGVGALGGGALGYGAGSYFDLTPSQKILATLLGGTVGGGLGYYVGSEMGNGKDTKKDPAKTDKKDSK